MSPQAGELLVHEIAPRLRSTIPYSVPRIGAEDAEELLQDALATAASLLASAEARGKAVSAGNVAYYAVKLTKSGRRSTGYSRTDAMHPGTQVNGRSRVVSLEEPVAYDEEAQEPVVLGEVLVSEAPDPALAGARNLDWRALLSTLDAKSRAILHGLAQETPLQEVATACRVSRTSVQTQKERLARAVRLFLGEDLLAQAQAAPRWRDNLTAARERVACRLERQAA